MIIKKQREAFSMLTAIFVMLIMASVGAFIMNLAGKMTQVTTQQYQREQAVLLAKSYTELAIMAVMSNDRNGTGECISDITGVIGPTGASTDGTGYKVETRISFIGSASDIASCADTREHDNPNTASSTELNIIVDVYVRYKDINSLNPSTSPWTSYHKRTLQKI